MSENYQPPAPQIPTRVVIPKTKAVKAIVAGIGAAATAVMSYLAGVSVLIGDDAIDFSEVGAFLGLTATLVGTVVAVYQATNTAVRDPQGRIVVRDEVSTRGVVNEARDETL